MFTGIVEEVGRVRSLTHQGESAKLWIEARRVLEGIQVGESIAVNGVCLTVEALEPGAFGATLMAETLQRTTLGDLSPGERVNLERALRADGRLGGHFVNGHVDGIGRVVRRVERGETVEFEIETDPELMEYMVPKGSVAVDGVSLTVVECGSRSFLIATIPHTREATTIGEWHIGRTVNIEVDILGKYVVETLRRWRWDQGPWGGWQREPLTYEMLEREGF